MPSIVYSYRRLGQSDEYIVEGKVPSAGNDVFLLAAVASELAAKEIAEHFNKLALVADAMDGQDPRD